jgi:hypothetical protein
MLGDEEEVQRKGVNLKPVRSNAPRSYLQSEFRYEAGPGVFYREITDFYVLDRPPFAARIEFMEGDPKGSTYRSILDHVVRSIAATEPLRKK